jgi:hypothetical protein
MHSNIHSLLIGNLSTNDEWVHKKNAKLQMTQKYLSSVVLW